MCEMRGHRELNTSHKYRTPMIDHVKQFYKLLVMIISAKSLILLYFKRLGQCYEVKCYAH